MMMYYSSALMQQWTAVAVLVLVSCVMVVVVCCSTSACALVGPQHSQVTDIPCALQQSLLLPAAYVPYSVFTAVCRTFSLLLLLLTLPACEADESAAQSSLYRKGYGLDLNASVRSGLAASLRTNMSRCFAFR